MKKVYIYALYALLGTGLVSCEDMLTEKPSAGYDADNYFDSDAKAEAAVMGIYNSVSDFHHYGWYEMATPSSDDTYFTSRTHSDGQVHDIAHYRTTATNEWIEALWTMKYEAINRANSAITGIRNMKDYESSDRLKELEAEARFLRAFIAFDLVKYWGDVPFTTEPTLSYADAYRPRESRETIYEQIIDDLDFAKNTLPWADEASSNTPERPTQGAARGLLMRVYLQRAGYSLQTDGNMTRPDENKRKAYFTEVTNEWNAFETHGYHGFYDDGYAKLFEGYSAGVLNTKESLFEIALYHQEGKRTGSAWGIYNGPSVAEPTGINMAEASRYMGRSNAFYLAVPEWYDFYETETKEIDGKKQEVAKDLRRDVAICTYRYIWDATTKEHKQENRARTSWYVGKWRREWMSPETRNKNMNYGDVNFCPLRYADVVLMAAEAYNELGDTPKAWNLLDEVRNRAQATPYDNGTNYETLMEKRKKTHNLTFIDDSTPQGKFRTALYWERGFELAFEGQRKFDLIRWGVLGDALKLFGETSSVNAGDRSAYPAYENFIKGKHELFPIPLRDLQSNPKLEGKNNPGY